MPPTLHGPENAPSTTPDALDRLLECHDRIRRFSALSVRVADSPGPGAEGLAEAASQLRRYFAEALPLHHLDEDVSLAPRLLRVAPELTEVLARQARDHTAHEPLLERLLEQWSRLAGGLAPGTPHLADWSRELERHLLEHLRLEESEILPVARARLSAEEVAAIGREVRERRPAR